MYFVLYKLNYTEEYTLPFSEKEKDDRERIMWITSVGILIVLKFIMQQWCLMLFYLHSTNVILFQFLYFIYHWHHSFTL